MISLEKARQEALILLNAKDEETRLEVECLLTWVLKKNRTYLYAHPETILEPKQWETFQESLHQRRMGRPIAYITGHRAFWTLDLEVNEHTLIPRHETELLVELALELLPHKKDLKVLDLGTGSGAIALALAHERPQWQIDASDYSLEALNVAKKNASRHEIKNVQFYSSDWFKNLPPKTYDAILSNPPYVAENSKDLQTDFEFEPYCALFSGQEGLSDLHYIIDHSRHYLKAQGLLLLEHGFDQKNSIWSILKKLGFRKLQFWQDLQGHDRVSGAYFPGF